MKPTCSFFRKAATALALVCAACCASPARSLALPAGDSTRPDYGAIAQQMERDTNIFFIIATALNDGVLQLNQPYKYIYENGQTRFNDTILPEPYQSRYSKLMHDFAERLFTGHGNDLQRIESGGVSLAEVLDTNSSFRKRSRPTPLSPIMEEKSNVELVNMLLDDKIVREGRDLHVAYEHGTLRINGKKLSAAHEKKYKQWIQDKGKGDTFTWYLTTTAKYHGEQ